MAQRKPFGNEGVKAITLSELKQGGRMDSFYKNKMEGYMATWKMRRIQGNERRKIQSILVKLLDHITLYSSQQAFTVPKKIMTKLQNNGGYKGPLEVVLFNLQEENKIRKHRKYNRSPANNWEKKKKKTTGYKGEQMGKYRMRKWINMLIAITALKKM